MDEVSRRKMEAEVRRHLPSVRTAAIRRPCDKYDATEPKRVTIDKTDACIKEMRDKRRREVEGRRRPQPATKQKDEVAALARRLKAFEPSKMRWSVQSYGPSSIEPFKILFHGPPGAGTTSVIRLMERALYGTDDDTDAHPGLPTKHVTEHLTDVPFIRLTDCPRIEHDNPAAMNCLINVVKGIVKVGEGIDPDEHSRDVDPVERADFPSMFEKHLMIVFVLPFEKLVNAKERGKMIDLYRPVWHYLRVNGYTTGCIVTHGDKCSGENTEERLKDLARQVVNSPAKEESAMVVESYPVYSAINGTVFPLKPRYDMEKRALEFLSAALESSQVRLEDRMARARTVAEDVDRPRSDSTGVQPETHIRTFLWQQNEWQGWRQADQINEIAEMFAERDIFNFEGLRACFHCVEDLFPRDSTPSRIPRNIRAAIEQAVQQM